MFFSNKKKPDNGFFNVVPREVTYLIISLISDDVKSLNHLAMANSSFKELVSHFPHEIHAQIGNTLFKGTYAQLMDQQKQLLDFQHTVEVVRQQKDDERNNIAEERKVLEAKAKEIKNTWTPQDGKACFLLNEEKGCTVCCCLTGIIGGSITSFFISWPCYAGAFLGATLTTPIPIILSRGTQCCCNMCVQCGINAVNRREDNLDAKFPEPQFMLK
ncbi:hypothetical protein [Legionella fallonii]|uniref:F-box domain-containing protein n=1 Tax=Legionella fallonii LLAP-10 TaxID=1212491 RepID=A0A098G1X8_9GAMM|nr:hypothetical protein [Legionella fallonii]CEG55495.1 conserved protein of unknown function [Legionella fallonii LLAP-10]